MIGAWLLVAVEVAAAGFILTACIAGTKDSYDRGATSGERVGSAVVGATITTALAWLMVTAFRTLNGWALS